MTLLILNRRPIVEDIPRWLADLDLPLVLITARSVAPPAVLDRAKIHYREIVVVDDYDAPSVEGLILETARRNAAGRILSTAEVDVLRAARARQQLSLPGQTVASARAFRDKFSMKTLAAEAGIAVAPMQRLTRSRDLIDFCHGHGFPVVVKPIDGGGSVGVRILSDGKEVESYLASANLDAHGEDPGRQVMVEAWVEGDFYTIDGLMARGSVLQLWPSRTTANLKAVLGPTPLISWMGLRDDPIGLRIRNLVASVVRALPATEEVTALHAEVFHTPDDRLLLCEIACRPGGCGHVPVYERALGVNLHIASLRGQAGCTEPPADLTARPRCMAGFGWFPPRRGILRQLPDVCPIPGVFSYSTSGALGATYEGASSVADNIARALLDGPADQELKPRLDALEAWWDQACLWQPTD